MKTKAHSYIKDLIYGRKKSLPIGAFLRLLSLFYALAIRLRHMFYAIGVFRQQSLALKVISVGNITLGGTGKTPTVIQIAGLLLKNQKHPVIISRGYGREDESDIVVVSDGGKILADAKSGGDEPLLISSVLSGVPVVVGSDRYKAAVFAQQKFNTDTVVLDDGFQHIRLKRDLDIVLVDAVDPFGNGKLFPAGVLREPLTALTRAHVVLITGTDKEEGLEELKRVIRQNTKAKIFTARQVPAEITDITSGDTRPHTALRGTTVLAFSGIARPASFTKLLRTLGADIRAEVAYPDHYAYNKSELTALFKKAADANVSMIITTEKDAVKLKPWNPDGIWALRLEMNIVENNEWEEVLLRDHEQGGVSR
ncbi:MAG TPA: tetraacyldisaccharide 4'-kinase [Nitrospirota bacterium]|nr:tetraacyldisaccharide 4'-kinase [Nitrospirota bacterium]